MQNEPEAITPSQFVAAMLQEKDLDPRIYRIVHEGVLHMVESDFMIALCVQVADARLVDLFSRHNFYDGDFHDLLRHLAVGYIVNGYQDSGPNVKS